ncbi:RadC family protein [Caldithrix abyssi]|uniref:DNA repair protein RadC n=1 Tax=Caldithrix abyssi DSM 13497 TaxID=880073 RepID=H1XT56_CALAY|nr:DNA repair protein RadC [Caldithrix abyssi]APF18635.1 DNA replication and repair protein RadC [Caldithrix abyssi DSM 13497]EHO42623.1 DNA repair protein RadC [Caldithrix abyssi DSM 13497]
MNRINEPQHFRARITDWPLEERPREKLMRFGADSVSNAELIAILLGQGTTRLNAVELAKKMLRAFGSLEALSNASLKEMQQVKGIGPAKAVTMLAAFQLYRNLQKEVAEREIVAFREPAKVARAYQPILGHLKQEVFYVILLNNNLERIQDFRITQGTLDASLVHPREVFNPAIRYLAKGIIVLHNHPSGQKRPSQADIDITRKLVESGKILDIPVYDHVIITQDDYFSFKENGLMDNF